MKKPRPSQKIGRKRRAAGWTLLTLGVLMAGVWVLSRRYELKLSTSENHFCCIGQGLVHVCYYTDDVFILPEPPLPPLVNRWNFGKLQIEFTNVQRKRFYLWNYYIDELSLLAPFWPIPLLLWPPAAMLLRSGILARCRAMTNTCTKCGYSLARIAMDAQCPECGKQDAPRVYADRSGKDDAR